jgi:hypothetical protein
VAAALAATPLYPAAAQWTTAQGVSDCSHYAATEFKRSDPGFKTFVIDRASVSEERYARKIGHQYVSKIYSGTASYDTGSGPRKVMFVCLHDGHHDGAIFLYTLPR